MKTLNRNFVGALVGIFIGLTMLGCTKIEPAEEYLPKTPDAKADLIERINATLSETQLPKSGTIDARNLNNFLDGFGQYFEGMIISINHSEALNPSNTETEYVSRFSDYLAAHPIAYDFSDFVFQDQEFFGQLAEIIRTLDGGSGELTVHQLRILENIFVETTLISDLEREALLALSSFRKFVIATIEVHGLSAMGETVVSPSPLMSCFEDQFNAAFESCASTLADTRSPVSMFFAWASLPGFLTSCIGDATYAGIVNC